MMYFLPFWKSISPFSPDAAQPHDDVMCICNMPVPLWGRFFLLLQKALLAIRDETADTLARLRNLAVELRPPALDELGIEAALEKLVADYRRKHAVGIELVCAVETVPGDVESLAVYRIVQECLTNIVRHSHATRALIRLTAEERIVLYVKDNGDGITQERIRAVRRENHMGITGSPSACACSRGGWSSLQSCRSGRRSIALSCVEGEG